MARLLVLSILLGNTLAVWASTQAVFMEKKMSAPACHMMNAKVDRHKQAMPCCQDMEDCAGVCVSASSSTGISVFTHDLSFTFPSGNSYLSFPSIPPEGLSADVFYRPPILAA